MMSTMMTLVLGLGTLASLPGELKWVDDYGAALREAKAARMPLLVVLDRAADRSLRTQEVNSTSGKPRTELLAKYKLCRVDVTTPYGQAVAERFKATAFPTTAIIDRTGSVVIFRKAGQLSDDEWTAALARHHSGQRRLAVRRRVICFT